MKRKQNSHLTHEERCQIYALLQVGNSMRAISRLLGVSHTSISREVKRNISGKGYRHKHANRRACARRLQASRTARKMTPEVIDLIKIMLADTDPSPVQISGTLKKDHGIHVSNARQ